MEELTFRLLRDERAGGPHHMAADEVLLQAAASGVASLRFYTWQRPTLSLGYFQKAEDRLDDPLLADLPFVRRASGGHALVHHHELTYCLTAPTRFFGRSGPSWLCMHEAIAAALAEFGVRTEPYVAGGEDRATSFLCFQHFTAGDLMIGPAKIAGSAQRKQRGGIMQHGGILLSRSPYTPSLPGILELTGVLVDPHELRVAIVGQMKKRLGWRALLESLTAAEERAIEELAEGRYCAEAWNWKR